MDLNTEILKDMENDLEIEKIMLSININEITESNNNNSNNNKSDSNNDEIENSCELPNLCIECGCNLGRINPRQYCGKTYCYNS